MIVQGVTADLRTMQPTLQKMSASRISEDLLQMV